MVKEAGLDDGAWPPKQMQWQINSWKDEGIRADKVNDNGDFYAQTVKGIYKHYEEACLNDSLVDFAELLLKAYELVKTNKTVKDFFHNRFKAVLVDEFQDTNTIQYNWLKEVASDVSTITAVGDDDQSIYGWRGAKVENIASFEASFDKAKIIRLEQNYRSPSVILSAANALIDNNQDRLGILRSLKVFRILYYRWGQLLIWTVQLYMRHLQLFSCLIYRALTWHFHTR